MSFQLVGFQCSSLIHDSKQFIVAGTTTIADRNIGLGDAVLAYLPLAHIFEFVVENAFLYWGGIVGYGNPKTLTDTSMRNCRGDLVEFKPTVLIGVPAVWETVKKGIIAKVEQGGLITKNLFWGAYRARSFLESYGLPGTGILDAIVFAKVKEATGGRLRLCANGAGPISRDTQLFVSMILAPMIVGYGMTETTA
jgi:long-chain acyl-CoA synthetase